MENKKESALARVNGLAFRLLAGTELVGSVQEALAHGESEPENYANALYAAFFYLRSVSDDLLTFADEFTHLTDGGAA